MSQYDPKEMHEFLSHTPEKGLRQIMLDPKVFSETHFNVLIKIIRSCTKETFIECYEKNDFPKIKFSPNETKLKENFWADCCKVLSQRGIITPVTTKAA